MYLLSSRAEQPCLRVVAFLALHQCVHWADDPVQREISRTILTERADRATVILPFGNETPSNTNENFSTRDTEAYPRHGGGRNAHPQSDGWSCCGRKVRCQMLPTSVINPNTNLLFPSTSNRSEEERVEIVGIVVQTTFEEIEERISRVLFLQCFLIVLSQSLCTR